MKELPCAKDCQFNMQCVEQVRKVDSCVKEAIRQRLGESPNYVTTKGGLISAYKISNEVLIIVKIVNGQYSTRRIPESNPEDNS